MRYNLHRFRRFAFAAVLAVELSGCAGAALERPGPRIGLAIGAALVAGYAVQHAHDGAPGAPAPASSPARPPAPFNPCAGSRDCAK